MAPRHPAALNRSSSVCNLSARKLIIFVSVQLVLSPFISITADTLNGGTNNEAAMHQRIDASVSSAKTNDLGDVFVTRVIQAPRKNSSEMATSRQRPYDLSPTGNASIRNQSEQTISASRPKREHATFNKDSERVLSRKRRYLIFPPGSSLHIGKSLRMMPFNLSLGYFSMKFSLNSSRHISSHCRSQQLIDSWYNSCYGVGAAVEASVFG